MSNNTLVYVNVITYPCHDLIAGEKNGGYVANDDFSSIFFNEKTHWCKFASMNWVIIVSDDSLAFVRRHAIIWTNADVLSI